MTVLGNHINISDIEEFLCTYYCGPLTVEQCTCLGDKWRHLNMSFYATSAHTRMSVDELNMETAKLLESVIPGSIIKRFLLDNRVSNLYLRDILSKALTCNKDIIKVAIIM